jgi:prefoldin subunit 5
MNKSTEIIKQYLYETETFTEAELSSMRTDSVNDSIREIIKTVLGSISQKSEKFDTRLVDKSKGDIKYLPNLESLQDAVNQLEAMIERADFVPDKTLIKYLKEVERSLMNINKYSFEFKAAYRKKQLLLMLQYQGLIMSIFSALSYLISVMVDFTENDLKLKKSVSYDEVSPITTLIKFNKSVERGDFKLILQDTKELQEYGIFDTEEGRALLESIDLSELVMGGVKMLSSVFSSNPRLIEYLYKAAGIITLIISLREIFYMIFKSKAKIDETIKHVENFAESSRGTPVLINKLNDFSKRFVVDAEESTKMAKREIEAENKEIKKQLQELPKKAVEMVSSGKTEQMSVELDNLFDF